MNYLEREMLHGNAETLVLAVLARGPAHGYGIRQRLAERSRQQLQISFGRLYPLLAAMERDGLVTARWVKAGPVRRRNQYAISARGRAALRERRGQWRRFATAMNRVLGSR